MREFCLPVVPLSFDGNSMCSAFSLKEGKERQHRYMLQGERELQPNTRALLEKNEQTTTTSLKP
jgi:hypothetical protein